MLNGAGLSDAGCVRPSNQDRIYFDQNRGVFVVADVRRHEVLVA